MYDLHGTEWGIFGGIIGGLLGKGIHIARGHPGHNHNGAQRPPAGPPPPMPFAGLTADSTGCCLPGFVNTWGPGNTQCHPVPPFGAPCASRLAGNGASTSPREFQEGGFEAVTGQYGAGFAPMREDVFTWRCPKGSVLGTDEVCYNRRDITNKERKWPRGRRPLLTGGDRNAITRAVRAARAIQRTEKQLRKLGMLKAPTRRAAPKKQLQIAPQAGVHVVNVE